MAADPLEAYRQKLYKSGFRSPGVDSSISPSSTPSGGGSTTFSGDLSGAGFRGLATPKIINAGHDSDGFGDPAAGRGGPELAGGRGPSSQDRNGSVDKSAGKESDDDGFSVAEAIGGALGGIGGYVTGGPVGAISGVKTGMELGETVSNFFSGDDDDTGKVGVETAKKESTAETETADFGDPAGGAGTSNEGQVGGSVGHASAPGPAGDGLRGGGSDGGQGGTGGGPGSGDNSGGPNAGGPSNGAFWNGGVVTDGDPNTNLIEEPFDISEKEYVLPIDLTERIGVQNLEMLRRGMVPAEVVAQAIQSYMRDSGPREVAPSDTRGAGFRGAGSGGQSSGAAPQPAQPVMPGVGSGIGLRGRG